MLATIVTGIGLQMRAKGVCLFVIGIFSPSYTKGVEQRPKRDPVNSGQVTDPTRFSSASCRIIGTAWDPTRDGLSSISPVAYRHDDGGPALDADSQIVGTDPGERGLRSARRSVGAQRRKRPPDRQASIGSDRRPRGRSARPGGLAGGE